MTVSVPGSLTYSYAGDGATTEFSYPVRFLASAELVVVLEGSDGEQVVQTITTHYSVSGDGEANGGAVTMVTAPASGETLYIYRDTARKQTVDLTDSSRNPAQSVEDQLDRFAMALQDISSLVGRMVRAKVGVAGQTMPDGSAGKLIGWNSDGDGLENKAALDLDLSAFPATANRYIRNNADGDPDVLTADQTARLDALADLAMTAFILTLLDDADAAAARTTLGLGTAATTAASAYATAAQGAKADAAIPATEKMAASDYRAGTADKVVTVDDLGSAMAEVTLTDAATIAWDMSAGIDFTVTLGGNRTLGNPTNVVVGRRGRIRVVQDATGSRTLTKSSNHKTPGGAALSIASAAAAESYIYYDAVSATKVLLSNSSLAWS